MMYKSFLSKFGCVLAIAGTVLVPTTAKANITGNTQTLIDWDQLATGWTAPTSGQVRTYSAGQGSVDLSFVLGNKTSFASFGGSGTTPVISSTLNGSEGADNKSLHIQMDAQAIGLGQGANSVTMNTSFRGFSSPLNDVSFTLYDVDISSNNTWQDRIILKGFSGNQVVNPIFTPQLAQNNTIQIVDAYTIDGVRFDSNANNGNNGNVLVKFASAIDRFELVFTDGDDISISNPQAHGIGIGDITYTIAVTQSVPEPTSILGLLAFGTFGVSSVLKRKQNNV
ncbi:PEP-CTERM sorting domain-containing protein [Nostoc parmelioides]|nr:PEP-CTERM sorting domain-containing protein [Nostoc parmelioides]